MDKLNKVFFSFLFISILLILYSYLKSYPVALLPGHNTVTFHPFFWLGLSISFFSILCILYISKSKYLSLVLCVLFIFLFTSPSFFYYSEGSDAAGGYSGSLQKILTYGFGKDYSNLNTYSQWPNFSVFTFMLFNLMATTLNNIQKITMLSIILVIASNFFIYYSKYKSKPGINVAVYFMTFYIFLNWQPVPQVFGLALFSVLINLLRKTPESKFLLIVTFISLVFTHAFVSLWFIFLLFIKYILKSSIKSLPKLFFIKLFNPGNLILQPISKYLAFDRIGGFLQSLQKRYLMKDNLEVSSNTLCLFSVIQISYIVYIAKMYFTSLANLFTKHGAPANHELLSNQQLMKTGASALAFQSYDRVGLLTKCLAQFNTIVLLSLLFVCVMVSLKRKNIGLTDIGLFFAGIMHFLLGMVASVLGSRGLQISFIPVAGQIEHQNFRKYSKIFIALILLVALLFPANLYRMHSENTHYITNADEYGHNFFIKNINTAKYQHLVTNGIDGGRIANLQNDNFQFYNLRDEIVLSSVLNRISLIIYNEKFNAELRKIPHPKVLDESYVDSDSKFKKIYDSSYQKIYILTD